MEQIECISYSLPVHSVFYWFVAAKLVETQQHVGMAAAATLLTVPSGLVADFSHKLCSQFLLLEHLPGFHSEFEILAYFPESSRNWPKGNGKLATG